ncbi:MAG: hypothetical protein AAB554_03155 [Patescibacteria group bacterium]
MWRIFRWLDRYPLSFHKLTFVAVGLGALFCASFLLFQLHPVAGLVFGYGMIFILLRASHVYRFTKKADEKPQRGLPISEASDAEILRRVRRSARTEFWRRRILAARHEKGKRGDIARSIIERWEEAGTPDGKPAPSESGKDP